MRKWKILVLILVCMVLEDGIFSDAGGDPVIEQIYHEIMPRGVEDFSDGSITLVERPLEIIPGEEGYTVNGVYYDCEIRKEVSQRFLKIKVGDAAITYEIPEEQPFGKVKKVEGVQNEKKVEYMEISEDVDLRYTFLPHKVLEEFVLRKFRNAYVTERFETEKLWVSVREDGVYFYHVETGERVFYIPPPVMYEEGDHSIKCEDIHYEVKSSGNSYVIKKVIDEKGLDWLKAPERVYPAIIDSTTEGGFSDPWEESGLVPYGLYFRNVNEYVSPASGSLTVRQTDVYLPGRGLDLGITRIYTTPQLFQIDSRYPEEYTPTEEDSPWKIANGWHFDLPGRVFESLWVFINIGNSYPFEVTFPFSSV